MATSKTTTTGTKATSKAKQRKAAKFTKAQIVTAIKDWSKEHGGAVPSSADFWPARLRQYAKATDDKAKAKALTQQATAHEKAKRPIVPQVVAIYGRWSAALKAADKQPKRAPKKS